MFSSVPLHIIFHPFSTVEDLKDIAEDEFNGNYEDLGYYIGALINVAVLGNLPKRGMEGTSVGLITGTI